MSSYENHGERAAPNGTTPLFFGELPNQRNMLVNAFRAADAAPIVRRGDAQMAAETTAFVQANHALINDPHWVAGLLHTPEVSNVPQLSQSASYLPGHAAQVDGDYPVPIQPSYPLYGTYGGSVYGNYGNYPGQPNSGYGNRPFAHPVHPSSYYAAPDAPIMSRLPYRPHPIIPPIQRRSRSPPQSENPSHRRRSQTALNPVAPPFAPGASYRLPVHNYPPTVPFPTHYATIANHNLTSYNGVMGRRGAWGFSGVNESASYQSRRADARELAGQQERFGSGSDDVRNHISSSSPVANDEDDDEEEQEEDEDDEAAQEEEEDEEDTDGEQETSEKDKDHNEDNSSDEEEEESDINPTVSTAIPAAAIPAIPGLQKRAGKFHRGNYRLACDYCRRRHWKCVRPIPNGPCDNCSNALRGPLNCVTTRP